MDERVDEMSDQQFERRHILKVAGVGLIGFAAVAQPTTAGVAEDTDPETGTIRGTATDTDGDPIKKIELEFMHPDGGTEATTTTDENGEYTIEIAAGTTYEITVDEWRVEPFTTEVAVEPDQTHTVDIQLTLDEPAWPPYDSPDQPPYTNDDGVVETDGLRDAIDDWRRDEIETDALREVIDAWRSGESLT